MKYLDEYRDAGLARGLASSIADRITQPWTIMEICGGQTHAIVKYGIDELLPEGLVTLSQKFDFHPVPDFLSQAFLTVVYKSPIPE